MAALAYLIGRPQADLTELLTESAKTSTRIDAEDKLFAATRLDETNFGGINDARFAHCTFANVSFKGLRLDGVTFKDCVFVACYFRAAKWTNCHFQSCRFVDSHVERIQITTTRFFYCEFSGCFIPYDRIRSSFPNEANLRRDLAHNLAIQAAELGYSDDARKFRLCEIEANEAELRGAFWRENDYFETHYPTFRSQIRAGATLTVSRLNRWLWGYGEKASVLVRNLALLALLAFPVFFYFARAGLHKDHGDLSLLDIFYFSMQHILEPAVSSGITPTGWAFSAAAIEGLLGLIIAGLLVSYIFQWILRR